MRQRLALPAIAVLAVTTLFSSIPCSAVNEALLLEAPLRQWTHVRPKSPHMSIGEEDVVEPIGMAHTVHDHRRLTRSLQRIDFDARKRRVEPVRLVRGRTAEHPLVDHCNVQKLANRRSETLSEGREGRGPRQPTIVGLLIAVEGVADNVQIGRYRPFDQTFRYQLGTADWK